MSSSSQQTTSNQNIEKFLNYDHRPTGNIVKLKDSTEFYASGNPRSKHGVVMIPDTMGWNAGRIRNIADFFAANDCYVTIPKLMGGSSQGNAPSYFESENLGQYMKGLTFDASLKPKIATILKFMEAEGIDKICVIGFSWGGWVATNVLASDLSKEIVCGILAHPTIDLEEKMYGGNTAELFSNLQRPVLLLLARGDPQEYTSLARLLKYKCPTTEVIDYHNIEHGFLLRGNIDNEQTKRACTKSLQEMLSYLQHHFNVNLNELVRDLGDEARLFVGDNYGEKSKTWWEEGRDRTEQTRQGMYEGYDRAKQSMQQTGEQMQQQWEQTKQQTQETWDKTKQQSQEGHDRVKQQTQQGYDAVKERTNQAGQEMQEGYGRAKEQTRETGQSAGEYVKQAGETLKQTAERIGEGIKQTFSGSEQEQQQQEEQQQSRQQEDKKKGKGK